MLTDFTCKGTFYSTRLCVRVDYETEEAEALLRSDERVLQTLLVPFHAVSNPERADAWISKHLEALHRSLAIDPSLRVEALPSGLLARVASAQPTFTTLPNRSSTNQN